MTTGTAARAPGVPPRCEPTANDSEVMFDGTEADRQGARAPATPRATGRARHLARHATDEEVDRHAAGHKDSVLEHRGGRHARLSRRAVRAAGTQAVAVGVTVARLALAIEPLSLALPVAAIAMVLPRSPVRSHRVGGTVKKKVGTRAKRHLPFRVALHARVRHNLWGATRKKGTPREKRFRSPKEIRSFFSQNADSFLCRFSALGAMDRQRTVHTRAQLARTFAHDLCADHGHGMVYHESQPPPQALGQPPGRQPPGGADRKREKKRMKETCVYVGKRKKTGRRHGVRACQSGGMGMGGAFHGIKRRMGARGAASFLRGNLTRATSRSHGSARRKSSRGWPAGMRRLNIGRNPGSVLRGQRPVRCAPTAPHDMHNSSDPTGPRGSGRDRACAMA